ncbi:MAG: hypothetical protein PHE03_08865 [Bacteroidales bacterium]|nr:hypothetical protein [Bacteroidales bacterium]MDD3892398.1 hypothetical protein [Bacteroidales bacterium]
MRKSLILTLLIGLLFSQNLFADSPLTSTPISEAYAGLEIVQLASTAEGRLTVELMSYLNESIHPIELKIAVINQLGWGNGFNNSSDFYEYLEDKYSFKDANDFLDQASADLLICMAYLQAMENYFDVDEPIIYANKAKSKRNESYTINIICALIEAQKAFDSDWCEVYNLTNNVRINQSLNVDMQQDAINIIFEYMDLYRKYCE